MGTPALAGHVGRALRMDSGGGVVHAACPGADSSSRLLCVAVGQLDRPSDLADDGYDSWVTCTSSSARGWAHCSGFPEVTGGWADGLLGAVPGGSLAQAALPAPLPLSAPLLWALEGEWTCVRVLTLPRKEESVAEHQGQGGSCPVHVPRVSATASGE